MQYGNSLEKLFATSVTKADVDYLRKNGYTTLKIAPDLRVIAMKPNSDENVFYRTIGNPCVFLNDDAPVYLLEGKAISVVSLYNYYNQIPKEPNSFVFVNIGNNQEVSGKLLYESEESYLVSTQLGDTLLNKRSYKFKSDLAVQLLINLREKFGTENVAYSDAEKLIKDGWTKVKKDKNE